MLSPTDWGWLVLLFPLVGTVLLMLGWPRWPGRTAGWVGSASIGLAFASAIGMLVALNGEEEAGKSLVGTAYEYVGTSGFTVDLSILVDPLSIVMCLVVTGVSFLIHLYSVAYMTGDTAITRFFAYLNFFVFSMLVLVLAANFVLLIVGWAFVGAASYLLISFWYRRTTATKAGMKAFVINVVGDIGLVIGAFLLFEETGALDYAGVFLRAPEVFSPNESQLVIACVLLLVGAFAKSAQLPLHTWLPDAMEGPTPVSSLIHAATMVTAGVYLIARCFPLFELAPTAADIGAIIGCATLIFAASIALVQTDLKRVIAYSTMSQIGYMIMGVSVAAYGAGIFHLMTHAFFKALLFMGAGSVIGAMAGEQSMDKMGGFRKAMPFTYATFVIGALALAGFPLMSGFFSKDEILAYTLNRGGWFVILGVVGYIAALLTAFYAFRMVFRVFWGDAVPEAKELENGHLAHAEHPFNPANGEREDTEVGFPGPEHEVAEQAKPMKAAMGPLALLAIVAGALGIPHVTDTLEHFLEPTFAPSEFHEESPSLGAELGGMVAGGIIAVAGIAAAFFVFVKNPALCGRALERFGGVHKVLSHKYYFDEAIDFVFVRPAFAFGRFGRSVVESEFVQGTLVGGTTGLVRMGTSFARAIQTGELRAYAGLLIAGVGGTVLYFLVVST